MAAPSKPIRKDRRTLKRPGTNMRPKVLFDIRDSPDLDLYEYSFLMTVESRGDLFTASKQTFADMRMGKTKYYEVKDELEQRGLITVRRRTNNGGNAPSIIRVNASAVAALAAQNRPRSSSSARRPSDAAPRIRRRAT